MAKENRWSMMGQQTLEYLGFAVEIIKKSKARWGLPSGLIGHKQYL